MSLSKSAVGHGVVGGRATLGRRPVALVLSCRCCRHCSLSLSPSPVQRPPPDISFPFRSSTALSRTARGHHPNCSCPHHACLPLSPSLIPSRPTLSFPVVALDHPIPPWRGTTSLVYGMVSRWCIHRGSCSSSAASCEILISSPCFLPANPTYTPVLSGSCGTCDSIPPRACGFARPPLHAPRRSGRVWRFSGDSCCWPGPHSYLNPSGPRSPGHSVLCASRASAAWCFPSFCAHYSTHLSRVSYSRARVASVSLPRCAAIASTLPFVQVAFSVHTCALRILESASTLRGLCPISNCFPLHLHFLSTSSLRDLWLASFSFPSHLFLVSASSFSSSHLTCLSFPL